MLAISVLVTGLWGFGVGARFPDFAPSRKGQYVSPSVGLLGTFGSMGIAATLLLALVPLQIEALRPVLWFLPLAVLGFWLGACALLLAWAAWHLERVEL